MQQTLRISVTLLNNRFHGKEWPSSPARLFSALLSGAMTGGYRNNWPRIEPALQWLEKLPAPEILASSAKPGSPYRISVPNNDTDIAARKWRADRSFDPSSLRTMKDISPTVLPPGGPHLTYCWPSVQIDEATLDGLRLAVHSLHTLGWGIDMAFADIAVGVEVPASPSASRWTPAEWGELSLAQPVEGSLADLHNTHRRFLNALSGKGVDPDTRPSVYRLQNYSSGAVPRASVVFALQCLDDEKPYTHPAREGMVVAAWMRHAVAEALREEGVDEDYINAAALGHSEEGEHESRLSYLPLPSIGHAYTDGRIRRVMIVESAPGPGEIIRLLGRKLRGWTLTDEHGNAVCSLTVAANDKVTPLYCGARRKWTSVTPIVLHGHNALRGQISSVKTGRLLIQAFEKGGFAASQIQDLAFQPAPFWPYMGSARSTRVPRHLERWPRYHVAVTFNEPVAGPVVAGIGRYYGLGLFAAAKQD
jgi:CRISPR-associated protein Csb2